MADENTQVAPVAGTETNATQENKGFTYYFSDPDSANAEMHHVVIPLPYELPELPWHWHTEKPDESLKDPVWNLKTNGWVENSKDGQAAILQEATQKIAELDKKNAKRDQKSVELDQANDKVDAAIKAMQQSQQMQTQQSLALTQGLQKVVEGQQQTAKVMASMQQILVGMKADQAKADGTTATNQPTENDKKQENGGN